MMASRVPATASAPCATPRSGITRKFPMTSLAESTSRTRYGGAAEKAGLRKGDVVYALDDFQIDRDGNYEDPTYGKVAAGHLLSTRHFVGDEVAFHVLRDGQKQTIKVKIGRKAPKEYVSDP